ncbi:MAG TPA: PEP-CTERM sorting domain-containing protein, partial [Phycisphaerae bacterium]
IGMFELRWLSSDGWIEGAGTPNIPSIAGPGEMCWNLLQTLLASGSEASLGTFSNTLTTELHTYDLNLASSFTSDLATGGSVTLHMLPVSSNIGFTFNSGDHPNVSYRPRLIVTAVPEPTSLSVLALAACVLIRRRRIHPPGGMLSRAAGKHARAHRLRVS